MLQAEYGKKSLLYTKYHGYVRRSFICTLAAQLTLNVATDSITRQGRGFPLKKRKKNYSLAIWIASAYVGVGTLDIHETVLVFDDD